MRFWNLLVLVLLAPWLSSLCSAGDLIEGQPQMKITSQGAEIFFAVKEYTDVTVEVVNAQNQVVRHLGSGVLGPNAPPPFQKDSKSQVMAWDLKDNKGKVIDPKGDAKVLVRAGLKPAFDRTFGGTGQTLGIVQGLCVDKDGNLYVTSKSNPITYRTHTLTKVFDREGNYRRTLVPFPANLPEARLQGILYSDLPEGRRGPLPDRSAGQRRRGSICRQKVRAGWPLIQSAGNGCGCGGQSVCLRSWA